MSATQHAAQSHPRLGAAHHHGEGLEVPAGHQAIDYVWVSSNKRLNLLLHKRNTHQQHTLGQHVKCEPSAGPGGPRVSEDNGCGAWLQPWSRTLAAQPWLQTLATLNLFLCLAVLTFATITLSFQQSVASATSLYSTARLALFTQRYPCCTSVSLAHTFAQDAENREHRVQAPIQVAKHSGL